MPITQYANPVEEAATDVPDPYADIALPASPQAAAPEPPAQTEPEDPYADIASPPEPPQAADPYADIATPVQAADPYADIADPVEPAAAPPRARTIAELRQDPQYRQDAQDYYTEVDGKPVDAGTAVDRAIRAGRRADSNTAQNAFELVDTRRMSDEQKARFARLRQGFDDAPAFWQEGGEGGKALAENLAYGIADPVNFLGGPLLRGAAKLAGQGSRIAAWLGRPAGRIIGTAGIDAAGSAGGNLANQGVQQEVGLRDGYSLGEAAVAGAVGAGLSAAGNVAFTRLSEALGPKATNVPEIDVLQTKTGNNPAANHSETFMSWGDEQNARLFDSNIGAAILQERASGVGRDMRSLVEADKLRQAGGGEDVGGEMYFRLRGLAGSLERGDQSLLHETFLPAEHQAATGSAAAGYGRVTGEGLMPIIESAKKSGIDEDHLWLYADAMRARLVRARAALDPNVPGTTYFDDLQPYMSIPGMTEARAKVMAADSVEKVIAHFQNQPGMRDHFDRVQGYFARIADYSKAAQVIDDAALARMRTTPPGVEFAYMPWMPATSGRGAALGNIASGRGAGGAPSPGSSPIRKSRSGSIANRASGLERASTYVKRTIAAADRNLAHLSIVDTVMKGQANGAFGGVPILRKLDHTQAAPALDAARRDAAKALDEQGIASPSIEQIDVMAGSILGERRGGVMINGKQALVVFRNGQQEVYEAMDPNIAKMLSSMAPEEIAGVMQWGRTVARWRADLITSNPVFVAKDFLRNSISSGVNSQFGFVPILSSLKGAGMLIKGSALNRNAQSRAQMAGFIREARRSGVGFASNRSGAMLAQRGGDISKVQGLADVSNNALAKGWRGWLEFTNQIEMTARLSEYALARKAGLSGASAGILGREVATDFAVRGGGSAVRGWSGVSSFFNAALQGSNRTFRALTQEKSPLAAAGIMSLVVTPMIALHALNSGQEIYDNLTPEQRATGLFWARPLDSKEFEAYITGKQSEFYWESDGRSVVHRSPEATLISLPIPQEFAALGSIINGVFDAVRTGNGDKAVEGLYRGVMGAIPGFHAPDIAEPFIALYGAGEDGLGRKIAPDSVAGRAGVDQVRAGQTSELAINLGQLQAKLSGYMTGEGRTGKVLFTPIELDYISQHFLPGLGALALQAGGQIARDEGRFGARATPNQEDFDVANPETAVTRGFRRSGEGATPEVGLVYDLARRADAAKKQTQEAYTNPRVRGEFGNREVPEETETLSRLGESGVFRSATETLAVLQSQQQEIEADSTLSAADKRKQLNEVNAQRNETARAVMEAFRTNPEFSSLFRTWLNPKPETNRPNANFIRDRLTARTQREP